MSRSTTGVRPALRTITMLAPVKDGAVPEVVDRLTSVSDGTSPFAASERTHFARLLVLPGPVEPAPRVTGMRRGARLLDLVTHLGRPQRADSLSRPYLIFSAAYDSASDDAAGPYGTDHGPYVEHLRHRLGTVADDLWGACVEYPGTGDGEGFRAFFARHVVPAGYVFAPTQAATVPQIVDALRLRRRIIAAAVATQRSTDAEVRRRFERVFSDDVAWATSRSSVGAPQGGPPAASGSDLTEAMEWNGWARRDAINYPSRHRAPVHPGPPDLGDVQGLTIGYPTHDAGAFLFLRITDAHAARQWLDATPVTTALQARAVIAAVKSATTGQPRAGAGDGTHFDGREWAQHIAVTQAGLRLLGVADDVRAGFDRSFRAGMARREHALAPGVGTSTWQGPYLPADGGLHVLVHLSARDDDALDRALREVRESIAKSVAFEEVTCERGRRIPGPPATPAAVISDSTSADGISAGQGRRRFVEHFGFADGVSQPVIKGMGGSSRPTLATGELLLGYEDVDGDTSGAIAPTELALNGTYLVFRKLEQDVAAFHELTGGDDALGAKLVGRHRDGTPLTPLGPNGLRFQDEDAEGTHCPIGAHIRRVNPRDSRPLLDAGADGGEHPVEPRLTLRHRMLRRGLPYGEPVAPSAFASGSRFEPGVPTGPDAERGLLFVALVGDIGRQFEFVQAQWMNDGSAFRLGSDPDVFAGIAGPDRKITVQGDPPTFVEMPRPVVTCRGGEYFFLPGVRALRRLAEQG